MQGALINALNRRQMAYFWHRENTMQNPLNIQGEAHEQLPKRIAWQ
jgi:hypothetical protein